MALYPGMALDYSSQPIRSRCYNFTAFGTLPIRLKRKDFIKFLGAYLLLPTALIVSRYFPPLSSAGTSIRLVKLMKFAAEKGWSFIVLTQDPDRPVIPEKKLSEFLLAETPPETDIIRVGNPFWGQTLGARLGRKLTGISSLPWGISVVQRSWRKFRKSKPDLIFVNSPPFTNVAMGMALAILFDVPFVVDMKDDWVGSATYWKKGRLRRAVESGIEQRVILKAAAVITVTRSSYEAYIQRYSPLGLDKKIFFIPNGEDLEEYRVLQERKRKQENERFRLISAAAGYRPDNRDLTPFLQAIELFLERRPQARDQIEIEFLGEDPESNYKTWLEKLIPSSAVHYSGAVDRQSLIERLWRADLFFLVQPYENFTAISGTLYEYWATGKAPVLLFAETGASSDLVISNQLGEHFHFNQVEEASRYLERIFQAFFNHHPVWIERSGAEEFDRRKLARQTLSIWLDVLSNFRSS
jgi:glycosyltransferase involved in cell wall biosynthesis